MTTPRPDSATPTVRAVAAPAFATEHARDAMLWPATLGILATLLLAWGALRFAPLEPRLLQPIAVGLAVVVGVALTVAGTARAARRWLDDEARAAAVHLPATVRWRAPGRADGDSLPGALRAPLDEAMSLAVDHARTHDSAHAHADHAALGENVAARLDGVAGSLATAIDAHATARDEAARAHALLLVRQAHDALRAIGSGLRHAALPPASPDGVHDAARRAIDVADALRRDLGEHALVVRHDDRSAPVRLHGPGFDAALAAVLRAAAADSAPAGATLQLARMRRVAYEDEPVRRAGDSPRTIVPRMPHSVVRAWVEATQPPAEVLSVVIADAGHTVVHVDRARALDPFGVARPADPMGLALADLRRVVTHARGCIWLDDAREGGTAVHLLLPIAIVG
ncbi:MAG: hypothetical protein MUF21_00835 [Gemmatimonadaceae bacterium]|nr:hypothetical protein [Gemmatimonadaceae bacterium]